MTMDANAAGDAVHELVSQRDQLRAWIARLDEVATGTPSRVAERVRADYEQRLRGVIEELSQHADEVQRSLESLRAELAAAEERRAHAEDVLEEHRLRHAIGELDAGGWERSRPGLEDEVRAAEDAVSRTRGEVERLSALSGEIRAGSGTESEDPAEEEPGDDVREPAAAWDDAGGDAHEAAELPFFAPDAQDEPSSGSAFEYAPDDDAAADEEAETPAAAPDLASAAPQGPVSGEELAAWITEVEAEAGLSEPAPEEPSTPPPPAAQQDAEGWDPFANEFGGSPANPATQPGDATQDLPWLDSIEGGAAGKWTAPADHADDLAFLEHLEPPAPPASGSAPADLQEDDLAFLEELDRAISGGAQRPPSNGAPAEPASGGLGPGFSGGSGGFGGSGGLEPPAESTAEQRKRGEALLCKECGAINEPQAWYCEICGSEL